MILNHDIAHPARRKAYYARKNLTIAVRLAMQGEWRYAWWAWWAAVGWVPGLAWLDRRGGKA